MPNSPNIIAHGELLIDFVPTLTPVSLIEAPAFIKAPGGAPANVAVSLAKLGESVGFLGQVGDDAFGHFLAGVLRDNGVDTRTLNFSQAARTALAFVSLKADGDRDFMFYRHPSADMLYAPSDVDHVAEMVRAAQVFHFGSISLIGEPARSATLHAIALTKHSHANALITYDPNLRLPLWPNADAARAGMLLGWQHANLIKVSEEELAFLTGQSDWQLAARTLWHAGLQALLVTRGPHGCFYMTREFAGAVAGFQVDVVDTTGAGDAFMAGMIHGLLHTPEALQSEAAFRELCVFANANGALATTKRGAIPAMHTRAEVLGFLAHHTPSHTTSPLVREGARNNP
jgi:fructokinase